MTLAHEPVTNAAPLAIAEVMQRLGLRMTFAKDEEIFAQDEDADMVYMVLSGAVRTTRLLADGRRHVGGFYYAGDLIGLEPGPAHRYSAEAICPAVVLVVRGSALKAFSGDGQLDRAVWEATRRELQRAQDHLMLLGRKNACEKVASFLMELAQRKLADDAVEVPMTRQDMADYLGLTIETVSRMLTQLQCDHVVRFRGTRTFDVKHWQALEDMAA